MNAERGMQYIEGRLLHGVWTFGARECEDAAPGFAWPGFAAAWYEASAYVSESWTSGLVLTL